MENLVIERTEQSPEVTLQTDGNLSIKGVSNINFVQKFYEPVLEWLKHFKKSKPENIKLILEIYYLNTASSLVLVELLKFLNTFKEEGTTINITWCYEKDDEDILDLGEDIQLTTKSEFEFKMI